MKANRFGAAASLIAIAGVLSACASGPRIESDFVKRSGDDTGLASKAALALAAKDLPNAIQYAERAVARTPDDAGFRALLGNAYFAAGRFHSAEMAYTDALSIYGEQPQVILKLALAQIAQGRNAAALNTLAAGQYSLSPADYGLALALAGKPGEAVAVLQAAARGAGANARVRQNLALAYALGGDWALARTVAAQDVSADKLDARIQQWMQLAKPRSASSQVATLVGVTPAAVDAGQPVRLALVKPDAKFAQVARAASPAPKPVVAAAPAGVAAAPAPTPAPVMAADDPAQAEAAPQMAVAEAAPPPPGAFPQFAEAVPPAPPPARPVKRAAAPSPAPVTAALIEAASSVRTAMAELLPRIVPARTAAKPAAVAKPRRPAVRVQQAAFRRGGSNSVVQLGAYGSPQGVTAGWNHLTSRYPALRAYLPMRAKFVSPKGTFYRLSVTGFADQREAVARCQLLKSRGGACFVRNIAGDAPVQYASR